MGRRVTPTSFQPFPRHLIRNHPNMQVIVLSNKEKNSFHLCNTTRSRILNKRLQPNAQSCTSKLCVHKSLIRNLTSPHTKKITNKTTSTSFFFYFFFNHTVVRLSSTTQATQNPEVFFFPFKTRNQNLRNYFSFATQNGFQSYETKKNFNLAVYQSLCCCCCCCCCCCSRRSFLCAQTSPNPFFLTKPSALALSRLSSLAGRAAQTSNIPKDILFICQFFFPPLRHWKKNLSPHSPPIRPTCKMSDRKSVA